MTTLKQELIEIIDIYLKDYTLEFDECYHTLHIKINTNSKTYEIFININEPWEKNKKRIKLNIEQHINECIICNETKELIFCDECLNEHCLLCFAHIIVRNKGTPVCPFCRDGEDRININDGYNNALKQHRYEEALKLIQSNRIYDLKIKIQLNE
jgi:hypothetical protein